MQNGSAELPVAFVLNLYGDAKFTRIFGTPILVNFGTVIVECKNILMSNNEEVVVLWPSFLGKLSQHEQKKTKQHDRIVFHC